MQSNQGEYFTDLLAGIITALDHSQLVLQKVSETSETSHSTSMIAIFDNLFNNPKFSEHFEYRIGLIGKSSQYMYWGDRTLENSHRHITLNLKSENIQFYNELYDNKLRDVLKLFKHLFSLIENFSISQNVSKIAKFDRLVAIIKSDFIYLESIQKKSLEHNEYQENILKAFKFLSFSTIKKNNWQQYLKILEDNRISYLFHFTDKSNLDSIREHKALFSWFYCDNNNILINRPGGNETSRQFDKKKKLENFVRLSFCENHPMQHFAIKDGRIKEPVILRCDPEVILHQTTLFSDCNANKNEAVINDALELFSSLRFDIFKKKYFDINHDIALRSYYQAEVLVAERLPISYILNFNDL